MKPIPVEVRAEVLAAVDGNEGTRVVAVRFDVSESWVRRIKQRRREVGQVDDQLVVEELDEEGLPEQDGEEIEDESDTPEVAAIPDLHAEDVELEGLRRQVQGQPGLRRAEPVLGFKGQCLGHQQAALALTATARDGQLL